MQAGLLCLSAFNVLRFSNTTALFADMSVTITQSNSDVPIAKDGLILGVQCGEEAQVRQDSGLTNTAACYGDRSACNSDDAISPADGNMFGQGWFALSVAELLENIENDEKDMENVPPSECTNVKEKTTLNSLQTPKDQGYSWVMLTASFLCQMFTIGLAFSVGAFVPTLLAEFGESHSATVWVGSLHNGFLFFGGPFVGVLTEKYGYRPVVIGGAITAAAGIGLSALATHIWVLYILYGIIGGFGLSCSYIPAVTILASYFQRYKPAAYSVGAAGAGIGGLVMPQIFQICLETYGLRGTFVITAGLCLQLAVFGMVLRQPAVAGFSKQQWSPNQFLILREWRFLLLLLNMFLFNFGGMIVFVLIADYAYDRGIGSSQSVLLLSIIGISNASGRLLVALTNLCKVNRLIFYSCACCLSGIPILTLTLSVSCPDPCFYVFVTCCILFGLLYGMQLANLATVADLLVGSSRMNTGYGMLMCVTGIGASTGPPFAGFVKELWQSYELGYYISGGAVITSALILIPLMVRGSNVQLEPAQFREKVAIKIHDSATATT